MQENEYSDKETTYYLNEGRLIKDPEHVGLDTEASVVVIGQQKVKDQVWSARYFEQKRNSQSLSDIRYCKLELHENALLGTMHVPNKTKYEKHIRFAFYFMDNLLVFIDDSDFVREKLEAIYLGRYSKEHTLAMVLDEFLLQLIEKDQEYLSLFESRIEELEKQILAREYEDFHVDLLKLKKEISRMYRYYHQMSNMVDDLQRFSQEDHPLIFRIFENKIKRLLQETMDLREYAMQLQDVYMSEVNIRQNDVMKVLTLVTTIFLPLTILVGWYGMNFTHMPELTWKYGYLGVFILSIVIVIATLGIFKKKKWM